MSQPDLFSNDSTRRDDTDPGPDPHLVAQLRRSAAWAAFGDALGFISELTDERGLRRRTNGQALNTTMAWKRRIGGRSGVQAQLPPGCYSDDTQLRLATSRSIVGGQFDVETFASIELPVFPSYALGGGLGTKAAATNLARPSTPWFANTYSDWLKGGGNGAAMRIQPHVWSAHARGDRQTMMRDVLRNTVCTHAHPIAILGAYLHAASVDFALTNQQIPTIDDVAQLIGDSAFVVDVMNEDRDGLRTWKANWQAESGRSFNSSWNDVVAEIERCIDTARRVRADGADYYPTLLRELGLFDADRRGSGAHTALAAALLASWRATPSERIEAAARAVGSDTDTIATMAGAILGCVVDLHPHGEVLDAGYIDAEVERISGLAKPSEPSRHHYPDLLEWSPPRTQADALCLDGDQLHVAGLGDVAQALSDPIWSPDGKFAWQWVRLEIGQTLLIKRRPDLPVLPEGNRIVRPRDHSPSNLKPTSVRDVATSAAALDEAPPRDLREARNTDRRSIDLNEVLTWLEAHSFDDESIGYALRRMAVRGTPAQVASFLTVVLERLADGRPSANR